MSKNTNCTNYPCERDGYARYSLGIYAGRMCDKCWDESGYRKEGRCSHMAFGVGPHLCPGAWISQQEAIEGSKALLAAMPDVQLDLSKTQRDSVSGEPRDIGISSIRELWLTFTDGS